TQSSRYLTSAATHAIHTLSLHDALPICQIPELPPCELYCHSLTDPTILSDELRAAGAQTLTLFGLHMPARLFAGGDADAARAKRSEEHTSELQSPYDLVCRLLLEKKKVT